MRRALTPTIVTIVFTLACGSSGPDDVPSGGRGGEIPSVSGAGGAPGAAGAGLGGKPATGVGGAAAGALGVSGAASAGAPAAGPGGTSSGGSTAGAGTSSGGASTSAGASSSSGGASTIGGASSGGSGGASPGACTRDTLQAAAKSLGEALTAKDSSKMALESGAKYVENFKDSEFGQGVWKSALQIAFQRDFLDVEECQTFSEIIVTEGTKSVLGVRLQLAASGKISEVNALVTTKENGWAFDADNYLKWSKGEDWSIIPEADRDTREVLIAAGNAYFDRFNDESVVVPWGKPCARLEGGAYTARSLDDMEDRCNLGIPSGITFADKHWIVDRDLGTATAMVRFGGANGLPDSHMFRSLKGKIRYVHTITVCPSGGCNT